MRRSAVWLPVCICLCGALFAAEQAGVWLDVPFVKQDTNGCGAASIAMVMQYWQVQLGQGPAVDATEIQRILYSRRGNGIYASDMERYFREHGFRTFAFRGAWADLKDHLEKGRPLVVALKAGHHDAHYVVVAGLDWRQDLVLKNDPAERKLLKQDRASFEKEWEAAANWTLLAVPQPDGSGSQR
jgi:ABC-type bacteriocin/lantibiotic exporter with double-glycine peptidase domain